MNLVLCYYILFQFCNDLCTLFMQLFQLNTLILNITYTTKFTTETKI